MANWKKVIVSGSNAGLQSLTASATNPLNLSGIGHDGTNQTPLVIDSAGNVQTGSEYAKKYGDNIVSASSLTSNTVIVGHNGSGIQDASANTDANFNNADVYGVDNMTASAYHLNNDKEFAVGNSDGVILGDTDTKLYLTGSGITISSSGGITASKLPTVASPGFYVGTNAEGHLVQVATGNDSNSSILGIDAGDNIEIDGFTTSELIPFTKSNTVVINTSTSITSSDISILNSQTLTAGDEIIIRYSDGTEEEKTVATFEAEVEGEDANFGITLTTAIASGINELARHTILKKVTTSTGVPVISLADEVYITGSLTSSGDLFFSSSDGSDHQIYHAANQILNITASNITASTIGADTYYLNSFAFSSNTALVTSGSTVFGDEAAVDRHQFTGSVFISGALELVHPGSGNPDADPVVAPLTFNVSTSLADATASIGVLTQNAADATASIGVLTQNAADATASIGVLTQNAADATSSIADLVTTVSSIKSFPYNGGDTIGADQAIITGSLLVGNTIGSNEAGSGHITASGHISASAVTASNMHVGTDLHVGGNLTVLGSNTVIDSTHLHVEDRFILLGSGSGTPFIEADGDDPAVNATVLDTGIIFESGSVGSGVGLFFNADKNRISIGKQIDDTFMSSNNDGVDTNSGVDTDGKVAGDLVTVRKLPSTDGTALTDTIGTAATNLQFGTGEMVVDKDGDIWIYAG